MSDREVARLLRLCNLCLPPGDTACSGREMPLSGRTTPAGKPGRRAPFRMGRLASGAYGDGFDPQNQYPEQATPRSCGPLATRVVFRAMRDKRHDSPISRLCEQRKSDTLVEIGQIPLYNAPT